MAERLRLRLTLHGNTPPALEDAGARVPTVADADQLALLMHRAYAGTVDDQGESFDDALAEVHKLLSGGYGVFDFSASEVVERDGRIVCSTLVTHYRGVVMIAFSLTDPKWQRQGLARTSFLRTLARLHRAGVASVDLAVTATNLPARRLYESLGFAPVER